MHIFQSLLISASLATALRYNVLNKPVDLDRHFAKVSQSNDIASKLSRRQRVQSLESAKKIQAERVKLPLDHWDASAGTFQNRYWVNDEFYKPGGPVFLFDSGEGNAADAIGYLTNPTNSILVQMAKQFNGLALLWEHRYYGESTPVNISTSTPATAFKYLTTEQALADVPAFAWNFTRKNYPRQDFTPASTPWVFIGGSYPGMRAAFVRSKYPETIFASYASSAPVQASIDMSFYFEPIWQGMQTYGVGNCAADLHAAILEMDNQLDDEKKSFALKEKFFGDGAGANSNGGFADALAALFGRWQGNGLEGDEFPGLGEFCSWISTDPETKAKSGPEGWAATKGAQFTIDRWVAWEPYTRIINHDLKTRCAGPPSLSLKQPWSPSAPVYDKSNPAKKGCDLETPYIDPSYVSWTWQYCTQWGFFQSANLGSHQMVSKHNSIDHQKDVCHRQFPDGLASGLFPLWPAVDSVNEEYGGWDIRPSQTFFGADQFDPWRTLSPLSDMDFSPKNLAVQDISQCADSDSPEDSSVFGYVLKNAQHCDDMSPWVTGSDVPRNLFITALTKWLGCFKPGKRPSNVKAGIRTVTY